MISCPDHFHKLRSDTTRRQTTTNSITVQRQKSKNSVGFLGQNGLTLSQSPFTISTGLHPLPSVASLHVETRTEIFFNRTVHCNFLILRFHQLHPETKQVQTHDSLKGPHCSHLALVNPSAGSAFLCSCSSSFSSLLQESPTF